jgi:hypothetical protein
MDKLTNERNWVIVTNEGKTFYYDTFDEALRMTKVIHGHLMTARYYEFQYNKGDN